MGPIVAHRERQNPAQMARQQAPPLTPGCLPAASQSGPHAEYTGYGRTNGVPTEAAFAKTPPPQSTGHGHLLRHHVNKLPATALALGLPQVSRLTVLERATNDCG